MTSAAHGCCSETPSAPVATKSARWMIPAAAAIVLAAAALVAFRTTRYPIACLPLAHGLARDSCRQQFPGSRQPSSRGLSLLANWEDSRAGASVENARARPKSSTFNRPLYVILMFAGLRSRCRIPLSCAYSRASISSYRTGKASSSVSGPASSLPSTSSRTIALSSTR